MTLFGGHTAFPSTLGPLDGGPDPRPARRPDDRRLRSARPLRGKSEANACLDPHGRRMEHAPSRRPHDGGTARIAPHGGPTSKQTPRITEKLNAAEQALECSPTNPPVININVGALLKKLLR
jgi:hypothetical protein